MLAGALALLAVRSTDAAALARDALALCARSVVPALFPFFVVCSLVTKLGYTAAAGRFIAPVMRRLFGVGGSGAASLALGLIGGYPTGARAASELYLRGECSREESERLLAFCNNCGPSFILGVAGGAVFGSAEVGWFLLAVHAASALAVGLIFRLLSSRSAKTRTHTQSMQSASPSDTGKNPGFARAFVESVDSALKSSLAVCAFVVFFTVLSGLLKLPGALLPGTLELTGGVTALAQSALPLRLRLAAASWMLGFGGLAVHCQALAFILPAGLGVRNYFAGKLLQGLVAAALTALICPWG